MGFFFISYQRKSKQFARSLQRRIQDAGLMGWIDENIPPGEDWKKIIDKEILESIGVIVIVTIDALKSPYVTYEWSFAMGAGRRVIPVIVELPDPTNPTHPQLHPKLADTQYLDFTNPRRRSWSDLIETLHQIENELDVPQIVLNAEIALSSHDKTIRQQAIETLRTYEHISATNVLARAINSDSPDVSIFAGFALVHKDPKDERALPGLARAIDDYDIRGRSLTALINMNTPGAVKVLADAFEHSQANNDALLRGDVMKAMARIKDASVILELGRMLNSPGTIDLSIVEALGGFSDPKAIPDLVAFLKKDGQNDLSKLRAIRALGKIGNAGGLEPILSVVLKLEGLRYHGDIEIFDAGLEAIVTIGGEVARQALEILLKHPQLSNGRAKIGKAIRDIDINIDKEKSL